MTHPNRVIAAQFAAVVFGIFLNNIGRADAPYTSEGALFDDGAVHTINGGTFTGGNSGSVSFVNYLTGIELDNGGLNLNAGSLTGGTSANNSAGNYLTGLYLLGGTANIYGGNITGGIASHESSGNYLFGLEVIGGVANIYGGTISAGSAIGNSDVNYVYTIEAVGGVINIHGGSISAGSVTGGTAFSYVSWLDAVNGTVNIFGSGFNFPSGPVSAPGGTLTGTLQDGTPLNLIFDQIHSGEIVLTVVPEPGIAGFGALALLALTVVVRKSCCKPAIQQIKNPGYAGRPAAAACVRKK